MYYTHKNNACIYFSLHYNEDFRIILVIINIIEIIPRASFF